MLVTPVLFVLLALPALPAEDELLAEGRRLLHTQQFVAAADLLEGALQAGGGDEREVRLLLSEVHVAAGEPAAAIADLEPLDREGDYGVALAWGRAHAALAAWQEDPHEADYLRLDAISLLEVAMAMAPAGDHRARVDLGFLYLDALGDHGQAIALADEGLATNADEGSLLLLRGAAGTYVYWNHLQRGDEQATAEAFAATEADLLAALAQLPDDDVRPLYRLKWLYEAGGRPMDAVEAASRIVDRQPDTPLDELYRLARSSAGQRQFDAAGKALEKLVSLSSRELTTFVRRENPEDFPWVTQYLAWSIDPFMRANDQATARNILAAIVAADPPHADIWSNYAVLCQQTSRFEDAVTAYEKLLTIDDSDPRMWNDYAAVLHYDLDRDLDKAKEMYQHCIDQADELLASEDLPQDRRAYLADARRTAQNNLNQLVPQQEGSSLLDSMLDGLRNLNLPADDATDEEDGTSADSGEGEGAGGEG